MSFNGILYSRLLTEKINPGRFDNVIEIHAFSTTKNALGEDVRSYTLLATQRALVGKISASQETTETPNVKALNDVAIVITWYNSALLDTKNKIEWQGKLYEIDDSAEVYGRKRFVRLKIMRPI